MAGGLRVSCFGAVAATVDGVPVELGGRRQRSVLGMLVAAGGRTVSTDRFLDEVWAGEPPPSATGALQAYVSRLRAALEPERRPREPARVLISSPPGYALALAEDAVDVWHVAALLRRAHQSPDEEAVALVDEALGLWRDDPFAEYPEDDWAATETVRLRELRASAVELRAAAALRTGRGAEVVAALEPHVRAFPLREQGVGLLARALYAEGRQADALALLTALRERLVDELGVDPGPEVRRLETDILQQATHLTAPVARPEPVAVEPAGAPAVAATEPGPAAVRVVGRDDEVTRLRDAARRVAASGVPGLAWLDGDAGIGKTTLLDHVCDLVAAAGTPAWTVVRGRCSEVAGAPVGWTWLEVLRGLDATPPHGAGVFDLATAVHDALAARGGPVLVGLEDVHRADESTLQVLRHLAQNGTVPVLVVATHRTHEVGRDLAATLAVTTDRTLDRISLRSLLDRDARDLLRDLVDLDLPDRTWRRLVDRAAGNPLFLRQLGRLVASEGPDAADRLPVAIRDLLRRRIERLPEPTVDLLSRAALLGRDVDLDLLVAFEEDWSGAGEDDVADHLDAGLVAGLLESPQPGELRFAHALVRDTFYDLLAPLRRQRLHRAALDVLRRDRPDAVEELAHHAAACLDRRTASTALPHLLTAAGHAGDAAAVGHLRHALRALDLAGAPRADVLPVRNALVGALARSGDTLAARSEREVAVAEARAHGDVRDVARAWAWPAPLLWSRRAAETTFEAAVVEIEALLGRIGDDTDDDRALRLELLCAMALECEPGGQHLLRPAAAEAVRLAEALDSPALVCRALNAAYLATFSHDPGYLPTLARRLVDVASAAGLVGYEAAGHLMLQSAALMGGDVDAARRHAQDGLRVSTQGQLGELLLIDAVLRATSGLLAGDLDGARRTFDEVCRRITVAGDPNGRQIELWAGFTVGFVAGQTAELLPDARAMAERLPVEINDVLTCALLDAGDVEAARSTWAPDDWERDGTWLFRTAVRAWIAVRLGDERVACRVRDDLAPWSGHLAVTLNGALVLGPVDHYLGLLDAFLGDDDAAAEHHRRAAALPGAGLAGRRR